MCPSYWGDRRRHGVGLRAGSRMKYDRCVWSSNRRGHGPPLWRCGGTRSLFLRVTGRLGFRVPSMKVSEGSLDRLLLRLWRFCLVLSGNRSMADDLVQAVCLRALERDHQFQFGTPLDRWIFRIAQIVCQLRADKVRRASRLAQVQNAGQIDVVLASLAALAFSMSDAYDGNTFGGACGCQCSPAD